MCCLWWPLWFINFSPFEVHRAEPKWSPPYLTPEAWSNGCVTVQLVMVVCNGISEACLAKGLLSADFKKKRLYMYCIFKGCVKKISAECCYIGSQECKYQIRQNLAPTVWPAQKCYGLYLRLCACVVWRPRNIANKNNCLEHTHKVTTYISSAVSVYSSVIMCWKLLNKINNLWH